MEINSGITDKLIDTLAQVPYISRANTELILGENRRTTDYRISTLKRRRELLQLKKGFYLSLPYFNRTNQKTSLVEYLASVLVQPSYISVEYMLSQYGLIPESVYTITSITTKKTRNFLTSIGNFAYNNIKESLYQNYVARTFNDKKYYVATPAKALFDLIYLTPFSDDIIMKEYLINGSRINWDALTSDDKTELSEIIENTKSVKMKKVKNILLKQNLI